MPNNFCVPFFKPGQDITGFLTEPIDAKLFVAPVPGGRGGQPHIGIAPAGGAPCGVLGHDGPAGEFVHFHVGGTVPVTAGADIVAGTRVQVGPGGTAIPWAGTVSAVPVGTATANAANGGAVPVQLNLG